ncbi:methyltransferase domain-containing protein [Ideonella sp.]|uniref:methyltransferase domain-containing protein n=1 Tax=Ideonella sp. TaxID=1929293 RepID=UPI002B459F0A|nr:methyltransferase domain-containing protein [Ideonella sp.]HJV70861.1 methyltransferase domain-containing protein [Ideonella sp.]
MSSLPPSGKPLAADDYAARHDAALDFETVCLAARQQHNLAQVQALQPATVLEVGCGPELLALRAFGQPNGLTRWVAVEPAARWAEAARAAAAAEPRLTVVHDYIEHAGDALAALWPAGPGADLVIVSGVIHETAEPEALLRAALRWLKPGGHLLVSVPNALSFHRLLAVQMGLIGSPEALSDRNRLLGQPRVYRPEDLRELVAPLGLAEVALDGYLFKPFTHAQMALLLPSLGERGVQGLIELGQHFPMQAAEIALLARRPGA